MALKNIQKYTIMIMGNIVQQWIIVYYHTIIYVLKGKMKMDFSFFQQFYSSLDFSFIELMLSTFFGFGSALLAEAIINSFNEKAIRKQLLKDLKAELLSLKCSIESLEPEKVYIQPYAIPIWKGAHECGSILCMDKEPYFLKILEVFSIIEETNLIEMKCFELLVDKSPSTDKALVLSTLSDNRQHVKDHIEKGLILLNGGN